MTIRIGRPEWIFAVLLLGYLALSLAPGLEILKAILKLAVCFAAVIVFVRVTRQMVRGILWRLRNRLIVAYLFIALVPVVLITLLVGLGAALVGGQLSVYLITAELERRTGSLRGAIEFLTHSSTGERSEWTDRVAPLLETRNPGLELLIEDERSRWTYPADASIVPPTQGWKSGSGLVLRDGALFEWAHTESGRRRVTALVPVTRDFLGLLAPDISESTILNLESGRILLHDSLPGAGTSHNRLPPAVNRLDLEIPWGAPLQVNVWDQPDVVQTHWLNVRTRPSALLRTLFAQKVNWASDVVPMLFFGVSVLFLVAELISFVIGMSITRTITAAIHDLYGGTLRARANDFRHRIPIRGRDQLAELATSFNEMTENMQRLLLVEKERQRLQAELEIAWEVQNQLYPKIVPALGNLALTAACQPARMVSGDYYDYQQVGTSKVAIAIGDVAGKGISAALLMATVQSSFRSQIRACLDTAAVSAGDGRTRIAVSTSSIVANLNRQLYADTPPEKYATFYLGVYDEVTSTLTYTNAGHLPPILVRNGHGSRLDVNGMVVGAFPSAKYDESEVYLQAGDLVVFFTDGITEPENAYGEMFTEDRLLELCIRNAHLKDEELIQCIVGSVGEWTGSGELQDDMTLLLVRKQ